MLYTLHPTLLILQAELIELLEKIVLNNSSFSNNHNLQANWLGH